MRVFNATKACMLQKAKFHSTEEPHCLDHHHHKNQAKNKVFAVRGSFTWNVTEMFRKKKKILNDGGFSFHQELYCAGLCGCSCQMFPTAGWSLSRRWSELAKFRPPCFPSTRMRAGGRPGSCWKVGASERGCVHMQTLSIRMVSAQANTEHQDGVCTVNTEHQDDVCTGKHWASGWCLHSKHWASGWCLHRQTLSVRMVSAQANTEHQDYWGLCKGRCAQANTEHHMRAIGMKTLDQGNVMTYEDEGVTDLARVKGTKWHTSSGWRWKNDRPCYLVWRWKVWTWEMKWVVRWMDSVITELTYQHLTESWGDLCCPLTPSLLQLVKFPGWMMHERACRLCIFRPLTCAFNGICFDGSPFTC